ncbi:AcrR family transcriptional regulator [Streptomyces sp. V3I8]|nr:AcrR family transcriptional regulator [Streptomyces sp. V3I8]
MPPSTRSTGDTALSLRAVVRRAGVSPTAPHRHFADRDALVPAVAAEGYRELAAFLNAARPAPAAPEDLETVAVAHVRFALATRPCAARCSPSPAVRAARSA